MIFEGTKVCVVSSSESRNGNKIRRGSLGYLSSVGLQTHIGRQEPLVIVPAQIIFTRFGFQNKDRSESKLVYLVFPLRWDDNAKNKLKLLDKFTSMAKGTKPNLNNMLYTLAGHRILTHNVGHNVKSNKIPAVVVKAVDSNIMSSENEFKSWLKSVLSGSLITTLISSNKKSKVYKTYEILEKSNDYFKTHLLTKKLKTFVDNAYNYDLERKSNLVSSLQCVLNLYKNSMVNPSTKLISCFGPREAVTRRIYPLFWQMSQINNYFNEVTYKHYLPMSHRTSLLKWSEFAKSINI